MKQTLHTRRQFLRTSALGAAASWTLPIFLEKTFFALDMMAAGQINPLIIRQYPLEQLNEAIQFMRSGQAHGRLIVTIKNGA